MEESEEEIVEDDEPLSFKQAYKNVRSEPQNPSIETLYRNWKDGELRLHPPYQRNFVWDKKKASNLIESILLDIPIPIIFTSEDIDFEEVIDGQQRLKSIFSFMDGMFPTSEDEPPKIFKLSKLKILKHLGGKTFQDLEKSLQRKIRKKPLSVIKIISDPNDPDEENIKFEMFERLNTNITKLNAQELRNCMYRGNYNDILKKLAENTDFQYIINKPTYKKRLLDAELVLLFFAFFHMNYHQYKGNTKQLLNEEMAKNRNIDEREKRELENQFKKSVSLIKTIFDQNAFRIYSVNEQTKVGGFDTRKLNVGLFQVLMYWFTPYKKNQIMPFADLIREELINLMVHDKDFINAVTGSGTNSKGKIFTKFEIWGNTLKGILGYPNDEPRCYSFKLKKDLFEKNQTCKLCAQQIHSIDDAEIDHIICYWRGGKTIPENAQLTHRICNRLKGGTS